MVVEFVFLKIYIIGMGFVCFYELGLDCVFFSVLFGRVDMIFIFRELMGRICFCFLGRIWVCFIRVAKGDRD